MRTRITQDVGDGGVYASIYVSSWHHCETRLDHVCHILGWFIDSDPISTAIDVASGMFSCSALGTCVGALILTRKPRPQYTSF